MSDSGIKLIKANMRREFILKRAGLKNPEQLNRMLCDKLIALDEFKKATLILSTISVGNEIDTAPIIKAAASSGKRVAVPRCISRTEMRFYYYSDSTVMELSKYGIPEPTLDSEEVKAFDGSFCLVPAIIADREGYRLGYGGGYYDRFLADYSGYKAAMVYPDFLVDEPIPREDTDLPVDIIVTL